MACWIQCDRCSQWRRVSAVPELNDDTPWYCENNADAKFADCSIPQELTDAEIDQQTAEAAAAAAAQPSAPSDADDDDEDGSEGDAADEEEQEDEEEEEGDDDAQQEQQQASLPKLPAVVQLISENFYSHRKRKQQDEDDIMVCHCPPPWRGGDGCGPNCINRMLCIECTEDFCPCENHCTNQMFTRKQYAKLSVRRAGPKGFGLYADEDLAAGQFVIQYVGEVLEEEEYLRRKQYYIGTGQRHYYFMNIGNGEVIDACRKGNTARFINHSCEPNCETQKWMVQGELAIGLFTLRKIKAGDELTFDYNFERYGDKPMRCFCGSKRCRKFIGGTQETTANIVELGDAEDVTNDPEPVLVQEHETDGLVQAMLDKEVGTTQRGWDTKLLNRLQQLCRAKGIDWSYTQDEAGRTASTAAGGASPGESSHAAGSGPAAAAAASPASSSAPVSGLLGRLGLDGAESRAKKPAAAASRRKRKADTDPAVLAKRQQQEERKRQRLAVQEEKRQRQQEAFLRRQEQELARIQAMRQQQQGSGGSQAKQQPKKRQRQQLEDDDDEDDDDGDDAAEASEQQQRQQGAAAGKEQQRRQAADEDKAGGDSRASEPEDDDASSEESDGSDQPPPQQQQQQQRRPAATRVRVIQGGKSRPPLAPKQQRQKQEPAAAPPRRSFLTLAVAAPAKQAKRRSEVDRRLEQLVLKQSWKLKEPSKQSVIKVLRMFNLCDITPRQADDRQHQQQQHLKQQQQQADHHQLQQQPQHGGEGGGAAGAPLGLGGATVVGEEGLPALPSHLQPLQALRGAELEARERESEARFKARQRARMTDMGMLLDVVLASSSEKLKKEWVDCGILTQLQQALGRLPFTQEYSVVLVKVVGVLEHLPVSADDLYTLRSAHGTFADLIRRMASSAVDWEVRRRSHQLLKRYAAINCSDATLLQLASLPGPGGKPYLYSLHLPPPQLSRLMGLQPGAAAAPGGLRRRQPGRRGRTPPPGRAGPPPPQQPGGALGGGAPFFPSGPPPPGGMLGGPPPPGQLPPGAELASPSTSHGGPAASMAAAAAAAAAGLGGLDAPPPSMAADSSGSGWQQAGPQQQQQHGMPAWDAAGSFPPPPWAGAGGGSGPPGSSQLPPMPGGGGSSFRQGPAGGWPGRAAPWSPGYGAPPGDKPEPGAAAPPGSSQRSPGGEGGAWGGPPPDWHRPSDDFRGPPPHEPPAGGAGGGGGPGGALPYSYRERERERQRQRESGQARDWDAGGSSGRDWQQQQQQQAPHDLPPHEAAATRQRLSSGWEPEQQQQQANGPPGGSSSRGGGALGSSSKPRITDILDDDQQQQQPGADGRGWQQQGGGSSSRRSSGWQELPGPPPGGRGWPPAAAGPGPNATAEDLFVLGVYDSKVAQQQLQGGSVVEFAWQASDAAAAGDTGGADAASGGAPLSPIVSGRFTPPAHQAAAAAPSRLPPGQLHLAMEDVFSTLQEPLLSSRTPGVPISALLAGEQQQQQWGGAGAQPPRQGQQQQQFPDSWEQPGPEFEAFVSEAVKRRLGKYVQPDHPNRITKEEAHALFKKLRRQVVEVEEAAVAERRAGGHVKPIERSKLEANIKEFVRLSIRRLHTAKGGGGSGGGPASAAARGDAGTPHHHHHQHQYMPV